MERLDRNLSEMTGELRVVVTGVQVLFAFLLVVPFDSGFAGIGPYERIVYFITLMLAATAAICTIAPSAHHRLLFRRNEKPVIVVRANQIVIAGLVCLALAILGSLLLVATKLFGAVPAAVAVLIAGCAVTLVWFVWPLRVGGLDGRAEVTSDALREAVSSASVKDAVSRDDLQKEARA